MRVHPHHRALVEQQDGHGGVHVVARTAPDHFVHETQVVVIGAHRTADHAVGVAQVHHHRADQGHAAAHFHARHFLGDAATAHAFPVRRPVLVEAFVVFRVATRRDGPPEWDAPGLRRRSPARRAARVRLRLP
ncbi:hypothetical protein G6F46_014455 [Rhizopus delemar]|nr:hypothetical protein G6F46_014455 [Rhizopus delemar]